MIRRKNYSLLNRFISLTFLVFVSLIFCVGYKTEDIRKEFLHQNLIKSAFDINQNLINIFHYTEDRMSFLATIISSKNGAMDIVEIQDMLKLFSNNLRIFPAPYDLIGWADDKHIVRVSSSSTPSRLGGISHRPYINYIINQPFVLHFSKNDLGYFSNKIIAPAAMEVRDKNDNYLGSLITGIVIEDLTYRMNQFIKNYHHNIYYALFSNLENDIIINSTNFSLSNREQFKKDIKNFIESNKNEQLYITNDSSYVISKLSNFPFITIIGLNPTITTYEEYFYSLLPYKLELLSLLAIIFGLIYLFYRSILEPFLNLSKAAISISNGDINTIIPQVNSKEGAAVADALEKMKSFFKIEKDLAQEVYTSDNKLSVINLSLANKVAERTNELEKALSDKTEFMNSLIHEIKTPLEGITAISEALIHDWSALPENKKFDFTNQIAYSTKHLLSLAINLLDISKLSKTKMKLNLSTFDLTELTTKIIEEAKSLHLHKKAITVNFINNKPIRIAADKTRINQVLHNLLINAIKFSPEKGCLSLNIIPTRITIKDFLEYEAIHFMITDQGIGIPEDELTSIFAPFRQGVLIKNKPGSVGLGLSICYEIIKAHNGRIWATNNKDGGATFHFILPITQPTEQEINIVTTSDLDNSYPNILMIDDEETCLTSMELLLHGSKYNLIKANSGQAGLKYVQEHGESISVILLDLMMPDLYGLNLLNEIKNNPKLSNVPVILQTGSSDEEEIVKAFDKGIFCFIKKPYNKQGFLNKLNKALNFYNVNK